MPYLPWTAAGYAAWLDRYARLTEEDRRAIAGQIRGLARPPRFLLVPLPQPGAAPQDWAETLRGVQGQIYPFWQLVLPDDAAWDGMAAEWRAGRLLRAAAAPGGDRLEAALAASPAAPQAAEENCFLLPLLCGAVLDETALHEFAMALQRHPQAQLLYADEDRLDAAGRRCDPCFKTAFDPELMLARDALGLPLAIRLDLARALGGLRPQAGPVRVALHDLALRALRRIPADGVRHVPAVLCHRRLAEGQAAEWDGAAARAVVAEHLAARGIEGARVHPVPLAPQWCQVEWPLPDPAPLVSVLLPTRDGAALLARSADAVLRRTDYPAIELLVIDNGSTAPDALKVLETLRQDPRVRVLSHPGPFNYAALNNAAAAEARGEVLLLLNNDTDIYGPGWLREMVAQALRPEIGAVGAKLLYGDGRVQHAGVVLSPGPVMAHQLRLSEPDAPGPGGELLLTRSVQAVTAACLAVRRSVFLAAGGLDAARLQVAFNDVDLCLRLGDLGYRVICTPAATLMHLESVSRGDDMEDPERRSRFLRELAVMQARWPSEIAHDPYHNPNLLFSWHDSGLADPPRRPRPWA